VISQTIEVIRGNGRLFALLATVCFVVPGVLAGILNFQQNSTAAYNHVNFFWDVMRRGATPPPRIDWGRLLAIDFGAYLGLLYFQASVAGTIISGLDGVARPPLTAAWRHVLPLLGIFIVVLLAIFVGSILLVVPGIMVGLAFSVAAPARVGEGRGVFGSIQRSRDLTRRFRWRIFLLFLLYFAVSLVVGVLIGAVKVVLGVSTAIMAVSITPVISAVENLISFAAVTVLYWELRVAKEGGGPSTLAAAFE
jgi:hypothetical protein